MHLKFLHLENFRNYEAADVKFNKGTNVITGANGAGKTNILEAVYYLSTTKSFRGHIEKDILRWGSKYFVVEGRFFTRTEEEKVTIKFLNGKKQLYIDDVPEKKLSSLIGRIPVVNMLVDDIYLISGPPHIRRNFMDTTLSISDRIYMDSLKKYNHILKQKNAALKGAGDGGSVDLSLIEVLNERLSHYGAYVVAKRVELIDFFNRIIGEILKERYISIGSFSLRYESNIGEKNNLSEFSVSSSIELEKIIHSTMKKNLEKEIAFKMSLFGPHRDDFLVSKNSFKVRRFGSTGEARVASIILRVCQFEYYRRTKDIIPITLIDDVFLELDPQIRKVVWDILDNGSQKIVATTSFKNLPENMTTDARYRIENGKVIQDV